jgi:peptidoglycan/LPS O-acetylase OafA/YrhL
MGYANVRRTRNESGEIRPMTGVRGIAALAVVFRHFYVLPTRSEISCSMPIWPSTCSSC